MSVRKKNRSHRAELTTLRNEIERLSDKAEFLSRSLNRKAKKTKVKVKEGAHQVAYQSEKAQHATEECIRDKPLASVGAAVALGVLVGLALKKR